MGLAWHLNTSMIAGISTIFAIVVIFAPTALSMFSLIFMQVVGEGRLARGFGRGVVVVLAIKISAFVIPFWAYLPIMFNMGEGIMRVSMLLFILALGGATYLLLILALCSVVAYITMFIVGLCKMGKVQHKRLYILAFLLPLIGPIIFLQMRKSERRKYNEYNL
jgi:hypothetical protein